MIDRRTALKGAALACGACALSACGGGEEQVATAPPDPSVPGSLATLADIPVGGAVSATTAEDEVVVLVRTAQDEVTAYSAVCPHQGCNVAPKGDRFECPCHGSRFTFDGEVEKGPARQPLSAFEVRVEGGQVLPA